MKTLFLIDGAAGTGKTDLLNYILNKKRKTVTHIPKYTTRKKRTEENDKNLNLDLRFPCDNKEQFEQRTRDSSFYWYSYGNKEEQNLYGFYKKDIRETLTKTDNAVIIVRDLETVNIVKRDFSEVNCVSVFVYADRNLIVERLAGDGYDQDSIDFRLSRQPLAWKDYVKYSAQYDDKIINSSDRKDFELLIEGLFGRWTKQPDDQIVVSASQRFKLVKPLIGYKSQIEDQLAKYPYSRNVFLMMKFRKNNELVYRFTLCVNVVETSPPFELV